MKKRLKIDGIDKDRQTDELLNKENARETLEEENTTEGPEHEITRKEIEQVQMKNNKAPGPSGMTAEMFKAMDKESVE